MSFTIENPYQNKGKWHNGICHVHTSCADGVKTPAEIQAEYEANGYQFICFTDHNNNPRVETVDGKRYYHFPPIHEIYDANSISKPGKMVAISGYEASWYYHFQHMLCLNYPGPEEVHPIHRPRIDRELVGESAGEGVDKRIEGIEYSPATRYTPETIAETQHIIDEINKAGGLVVWAHPKWKFSTWNLAPDIAVKHIKSIKNLCGIEIYNQAVATTAPESDAICEDVWDALLSSGIKVWGFAGDDYHGALEKRFAATRVVVRLDRLDGESIVEALKNGNFYISTGVIIEDIELKGTTIIIKTQNANTIRFIGHNGRVLYETDKDNATYEIKGNESYVRIVCENDKSAHAFDAESAWRNPQRAWTQPFFVKC